MSRGPCWLPSTELYRDEMTYDMWGMLPAEDLNTSSKRKLRSIQGYPAELKDILGYCADLNEREIPMSEDP